MCATKHPATAVAHVLIVLHVPCAVVVELGYTRGCLRVMDRTPVNLWCIIPPQTCETTTRARVGFRLLCCFFAAFVGRNTVRLKTTVCDVYEKHF